MKLLLISDALHGADGDFSLHPTLMDIQPQLVRRRRQWFYCADETPLGWYAALVDTAPAALLAACCADLPASVRQAWVASPYHAQLGRDTVRLMPEGDFSWNEADSIWLCDILNPLLLEEGMSLHACGAALMLACTTPLDTTPVSFAAIAGGLLPNRHPEGADGGRLMRLLAEIQMSLHAVTHSTGQPTRAGQPDISGLWLWGSSPWPASMPASQPAVATRNPFLRSVSDGRGAKIIITECERLPELLSQSNMPAAILLGGEGYAVLLRNTLLPGFTKGWQVKSPATQADLFVRLNGMIDAA